MPPLRDRIEDIPILAQHFMVKYSKEYNRPIKEFSEDAMRAFMSYSWPGNIRELENKIQQIIVMSEAPMIDVGAIEFPISKSESKDKKIEHLSVAKNRLIDSFEKTYLKRLLIDNRGNMVNSARMAGKSRTGLWNLLKKYNITPGKFH
jgi:DNA-binding NtrC family response regulator